MKSILVEKTLVPIFYHYKRGNITLTKDFLEKASTDEPTSKQKYEKYLASRYSKQNEDNKEKEEEDDGRNVLIQNRLRIMERYLHKREHLLFLQNEKDCSIVLKSLLNTNNASDFVTVLAFLKPFSEADLQSALALLF